MGLGDELKSRLPEIALAILAAKQGGPQSLAAFQGSVNQSRQQQQQLAVQQQALTRQAQMDDERRQQQQIENERASDTARRADEAAQQQRIQAAIASMDRFAGGLAETATDPIAAENSMLSRGAGLESAFGIPQGQLSAFVPNMAPPISKRLQTVAKQTYEQAEKLYGPEAMANDSITITTEAFGPVKPSELRAKFGMQAQTATGAPAAPHVPTPTSLVPNTPEEQFYQQFAAENGAKTFGELSTKLQAAARKQWMQADDRPPAVGGPTGRVDARIDRIVSSFNSHPIVKEYNETQAQQGIIRNIVAGQWSGPGDMAAVFAFMKALDPNSVVRETEYANASRSGNIFSGWAAKFNGALSPNGGFLSDQVRQDFLRTINARMDVKGRQYNNLRGQLVKRIDRIKAGAPETGDEALVEYSAGAAPEDAPAAPAGGVGVTYQDYLKSRGR